MKSVISVNVCVCNSVRDESPQWQLCAAKGHQCPGVQDVPLAPGEGGTALLVGTLGSTSLSPAPPHCQKPRAQRGGFFIIISKAQNLKLLFWLGNRWLQLCQHPRCSQCQDSLCSHICSNTPKQKLWNSFLCPFGASIPPFCPSHVNSSLFFFLWLPFQHSQILRPLHLSVQHILSWFYLCNSHPATWFWLRHTRYPVSIWTHYSLFQCLITDKKTHNIVFNV